jgi:hypothetical protein
VFNLVKQGYTNYDQREKNIMAGLNDMIELVDFIDDRVVRCWKNQCWLQDNPQRHVSRATVCSLLRRYSCPAVQPRHIQGNLGDVQYVDILVMRHWIRNILWNLGHGHGFMDEASADVEMRPSYSLVIASDTVETCEQFSISSLEVHGLGLVSLLLLF